MRRQRPQGQGQVDCVPPEEELAGRPTCDALYDVDSKIPVVAISF